jgi:hypothetical protein
VRHPAKQASYRTASGYSVLDELTDRQIETLLFLAGHVPYPPRGALAAAIRALEWRALVARVPEDGNRWHATQSGRRAVEAIVAEEESTPQVLGARELSRPR